MDEQSPSKIDQIQKLGQDIAGLASGQKPIAPPTVAFDGVLQDIMHMNQEIQGHIQGMQQIQAEDGVSGIKEAMDNAEEAFQKTKDSAVKIQQLLARQQLGL